MVLWGLLATCIGLIVFVWHERTKRLEAEATQQAVRREAAAERTATVLVEAAHKEAEERAAELQSVAEDVASADAQALADMVNEL